MLLCRISAFSQTIAYLSIYCLANAAVMNSHCTAHKRMILFVYVVTTISHRKQHQIEYVLTVCPILLLIAGDVHVKPGPNDNLCDLSFCHSNIRSLSNDKMRSLISDLSPDFDIISYLKHFFLRILLMITFVSLVIMTLFAETVRMVLVGA